MYKEIAESLYKELCPGCPPDIPVEMIALIKGHYIKWLEIPVEKRQQGFEFYIRLILTQEPLSKEHALLCLMWGHKITHEYFEAEEYIENCVGAKTALYLDENGQKLSATYFWSIRKTPNWETGWSLFKGKTKTKIKKDE